MATQLHLTNEMLPVAVGAFIFLFVFLVWFINIKWWRKIGQRLSKPFQHALKTTLERVYKVFFKSKNTTITISRQIDFSINWKLDVYLIDQLLEEIRRSLKYPWNFVKMKMQTDERNKSY